MTVQEVATLVEAEFLCGESCEREVHYAFAADLMSDVLTLTHEDVLFVTGLVAPQTIRTAVVSDISTILVVRGKTVPKAILDLARENEICVLRTRFSMYRASGELYRAGLKPVY